MTDPSNWGRKLFQEQFEIEARLFTVEVCEQEDRRKALYDWCLCKFNEVWGGRHHSYDCYVRLGESHHRVVHASAPMIGASNAMYTIYATIDACVFVPSECKALVTEYMKDLHMVGAKIADPETKRTMVRLFIDMTPHATIPPINTVIRVQVTKPLENSIANDTVQFWAEWLTGEGLKGLQESDPKTQPKALGKPGHQLRKHRLNHRI